MQNSFSELIKLLLPEIIVEYLELTSYKKGKEILHLYLSEINSIPKEYRQCKLSSKGFFDEITVQDFSIGRASSMLASLLLAQQHLKWSHNQLERVNLLFELNPDILHAYNLTQELRTIFEKTTDKIVGYAKLAKWREKVNQSGFKSFNTIFQTIMNHYQTILNYFDNRSTNASAEIKFTNP